MADKNGRNGWGRTAAILTAMAGALVVLGAMVPLAKSDPPPWRGISESDAMVMQIQKSNDDAKRAILSRIVQMDIDRLSRDYCDAMGDKDPKLAQDYERQIGAAMTEYKTVAGTDYALRPCQ